MLQKAALEFDQGHSNQFNDSRFLILDYSRLDRGKNQKENVSKQNKYYRVLQNETYQSI